MNSSFPFSKFLTAVALLVGLSAVSFAQLQSGSPWPKIHGNLQNTNEGTGPGIAAPYSEWTWGGVGDHCGPGVIGANGNIYFEDVNNGSCSLIAVNSLTGQEMWHLGIGGSVAYSPAIGSDGTIYVGQGPNISLILDQGNSGLTNWNLSLLTQVTGSPTILANGTIVFPAGSTLEYVTITMFGIPLGTSVTLPSSTTTSPVVDSSGDIVVGTTGGTFYTYDSLGNQLSNFATNAIDPITQDSAMIPGGDFLGLEGDFLYELASPSSFSYQGSNAFGALITTPAAPASGSFYVPTAGNGTGDYVIEFPSEAWFFRGPASTTTPTTIQATDGTIYLASDQIYSLTVGQGSENWSYPLSPQAPMAMDAYGTLYMPDSVNGGFAAIGNPIAQFAPASSSVYGGNPFTVTVQFAGSLTSSDISNATVSSNNANVQAGALTQSSGNTYAANFTSSVVSSQQSVTLTATYGSFSTTATLTVLPLAISSTSLTASNILGGQATYFTVNLNGPLPAGAVISLSSSDATNVSIPSTVTASAGDTSETIHVHTLPVSSQEQVAINVSYNGTTSNQTLTLNPAQLTGIRVAPTSLQGGATGALAVYLNIATSSTGVNVALSSSSSDVSVPSSVTVSGGSTAANVVVTTVPVSASESVTLSATLNSVTLQTTISLTPTALSGVKLLYSSVVGGNPSAVAVYLNGRAGSSGANVGLASSSSAATLANSVTIPQGAGSANVAIHTAAVDSATPVFISATLGTNTVQSTLTVMPASLSGLKLLPTSVQGGRQGAFAVYLNGPAGPSGVTVNLSSPSPDATLPMSVNIPPGGTSASVTVATSHVASSEVVQISATLGSTTLSTPLTIHP
ncbi:MAG TPA: hypothetical protein VGL56_15985 [Fimbriimonadaceae bacterium]